MCNVEGGRPMLIRPVTRRPFFGRRADCAGDLV